MMIWSQCRRGVRVALTPGIGIQFVAEATTACRFGETALAVINL